MEQRTNKHFQETKNNKLLSSPLFLTLHYEDNTVLCDTRGCHSTEITELGFSMLYLMGYFVIYIIFKKYLYS